MKLDDLIVTIQLLHAKREAEEIDEKTYHDSMESLEGSIDDKFDAYVAVLKKMKVDKNYFKKVKTEYQRKIERIEKDEAYMKDMLDRFLVTSGKDKIKTRNSTVYRQSSKSVEIEDIDFLPLKYRVPQPEKADKNAIREALVKGEVVRGAKLVEKEGIRFR